MGSSQNGSSNGNASTALSLIHRAQNADAAAWERLIELYSPIVYRWARRTGLQEQDAADVMQEVFQSVSTNLGNFQRRTQRDSFRGWLWTITRNKVRDHFRLKQNQANAIGGTAALELIQQMPDSPSDSSTDAGLKELSRLKRRALELVSGDFESRTWQAFFRVTVNGETPNDVAADLGISVWAVYKARSRVLQKLRDEFSDLLD